MTETETASTSTSSEKDRMDATAEAAKILSQGKRNLVCGEVPTAVNQFQEACKLLAKAYGETAKECADAYFYYGQSLLDLARMETGVLGNALQGVPEEDEDATKSADEQFENGDKLDEEEREKLRTEVYDAMSEKEKEESKAAENKEEKPEADKMETDEKGDAKEEESKEKEKEGESKEETEDTAEEMSAEEGDTAEEEEGAEGETGEDTAEEETKEQKDEEDADDVSNLQLAWEMLELAKVIYMKEEDKEAKLKAADSFLKLGEVSLETEQYEQSISDFNECLKIQKSVLEPEDRSLAETYYQLGLAYCFHKLYDESIDSYRAAIKVLEDRIAKLSKIVEGGAEKKESDSSEDPVKAAESEIKEIKELLPDMRQKIEDSEEEKKNYEQLKAMAKEAVGFGSSESKEAEPSKADSKPASNISHLIRRKRKPDEEEGAEQDPKKTKQDGSGDAAVNGTTDTDKKTVNGEVQEAGVVAS